MSNIASCKIRLKLYPEAIELLEEEIKKNPNNTNLYNLAYAYYEIDEYDRALINLKRSMYFYEDELAYFMYGKICMKLGEYQEAIEYLKKAIYFIEKGELSISKVVDQILYTSNAMNVETNLDAIYQKLVVAYIENKQYDYALAINTKAKARFPYNDKYKDNDRILSHFIEITNETLIVEKRISEIEKEKQKYLEIIDESNKAYKKLALEVMNIQKIAYIDDENEENIDWRAFTASMSKILTKLKAEYESQASYSDIRADLQERYPLLCEKSLDSITTGELLFLTNKESIIDFAPIVMAYCIGIEVQLNRIFSSSKRSKSLGDLQREIKKRGDYYNELYNLIEIIRVVRNKSAHSGSCSRETVLELRNCLFSTSGLELILQYNV